MMSYATRYTLIPCNRKEERRSWSEWPVVYEDGLPGYLSAPLPIELVDTWVEPTTFWSQVRRHQAIYSRSS